MTLKIYLKVKISSTSPYCPRQFLSEPCFCRWLTYRDI